jgi:hypothetical protein
LACTVASDPGSRTHTGISKGNLGSTRFSSTGKVPELLRFEDNNADFSQRPRKIGSYTLNHRQQTDHGVGSVSKGTDLASDAFQFAFSISLQFVDHINSNAKY